ncbi:MAG: hypothetical protein EA397_19535 [Deltaproteobacteria bacterium]|nr:MAG: hypothetical protein EA397_19535 [Deltaproteobacteria bacterium]
MLNLPDWCSPTGDPAPRADVLANAVAQSAKGPVMITGAPGIGATTFGGAILRELEKQAAIGRAAAVAVDALTEVPDLVLAIGASLGATLPGDEASLIEALNRGSPVGILLDDADLAPEAVLPLLDLATSVRWILTGRHAILHSSIELAPLPDDAIEAIGSRHAAPGYHGRPLLASLAPGLDPESDWSASLTDTWPDLGRIADLPMGADQERGPFPPVAVRMIGGRPRPRRSFREALGLADRPSPSSLERAVRSNADVLHQIACDLHARSRPEDLRMLRTAARQVESDRVASLAAAAAARIHIRSFQASQALDLVRERLRIGGTTRLARGLLQWLEGDALLTQGSHDLAHDAHLKAELDLRGPAGAEARIALARRCADEWSARGNPERARSWLNIARTALQTNPDPRGLADTFRIRGNLAAQAGELVGAGALYDEALASLTGHPSADRERAFIRLSQAAIAIARKASTEAKQLLDVAAREASGHPLAEAEVAWRRAEVALRMGQLDIAYEALAGAISGFKRAGSLRGLLLCARMEGDLAAVSGDREAAITAWNHAASLCIRTRNLLGMRRVLLRRLTVEREGLPGQHIDELQDNLDTVQRLLRSG